MKQRSANQMMRILLTLFALLPSLYPLHAEKKEKAFDYLIYYPTINTNRNKKFYKDRSFLKLPALDYVIREANGETPTHVIDTDGKEYEKGTRGDALYPSYRKLSAGDVVYDHLDRPLTVVGITKSKQVILSFEEIKKKFKNEYVGREDVSLFRKVFGYPSHSVYRKKFFEEKTQKVYQAPYSKVARGKASEGDCSLIYKTVTETTTGRGNNFIPPHRVVYSLDKG